MCWVVGEQRYLCSVGGSRQGAGKRARGAEILNGHHGRPPRPNGGHPLQQTPREGQQQVPQAPQAPQAPHTLPLAPHSPSLPPHSPHTPLKDGPKAQGELLVVLDEGRPLFVAYQIDKVMLMSEVGCIQLGLCISERSGDVMYILSGAVLGEKTVISRKLLKKVINPLWDC